MREELPCRFPAPTIMLNHSPSLIESDTFPFEFLSLLAERESWRKEIHRPIYHVHNGGLSGSGQYSGGSGWGPCYRKSLT